MNTLKEFFTPKDLSDKTGIKIAQVWRYLREKKIAAFKVSKKSYLIPKVEFQKWLDKAKIK